MLFFALFLLVSWPKAVLAAPFDFPTPARSTAPIEIAYPFEGLDIPALEHEYIIGSVLNTAGHLSINGQNVPIYKDGAFIAWLPVHSGTFTFHCQLSGPGPSTVYDRNVTIESPPEPLPLKPLAIAASSLFPNENEVLRPGDWLIARMQATPRQKAYFWVPGGAGWIPMRENGDSGFYDGAYQVRATDSYQSFSLKFRVGGSWNSVSTASTARITFANTTPRIAAAADSEDVIVKTSPDGGNLFPVLTGMSFVIIGQEGSWDKVWLSPDESGWLEQSHLQFLPEGTPLPSATLEVISTRPSQDGTSIYFSLGARVPFQISESDDLKTITARFYYTTAHMGQIIYREQDALVSSISFNQVASDVVEVRINLNSHALLWGYHAELEGHSVRIDLRQAPHLAAAPRSPLSGLRIFLDPGHMPSKPGAFGPLGTREMDVNFAIAEQLTALLKREGAVVLNSRPDDESEVGLPERPEAAVAQNADLFVSIHNEGIADGQNPYDTPLGYSVFYYHPHSLALAQAIYAAYQKTLPIPGEFVRFSNLIVIRMTTEMPAVLSESAYISLPEQEALLLSPKFREKIAAGILLGLRKFLSSVRDAQAMGVGMAPNTVHNSSSAKKAPDKNAGLKTGARRKTRAKLRRKSP